MKICLYIICIIIVSALILINCSGSGDIDPANYGISGFHLDTTIVSGQCMCTYKLDFKWVQSFVTKRPTIICRTELYNFNADTLLSHYDEFTNISSNPTDDSLLSFLFIDHFTINRQYDIYKARVIWIDTLTTSHIDSSVFINIPLDPPNDFYGEGCDSTCCTIVNKHVGIDIIYMNGIDTISADMLMRDVELCDNSNGQNPAFSIMLIGIGLFVYDQYPWVQMGGGTYRNYKRFNDWDPHHVIYTELVIDSIRKETIWYDSSDIFGCCPLDGEIHNFVMAFSPSTSGGIWSWYYDGIPVRGAFGYQGNNPWTLTGGECGQFMGEIMNGEDDMPGKIFTRATIFNMKYNGVNINSQDSVILKNDIPFEFDLNRPYADSIEFWDKRPLN